jgi:hypothetical protein
LRVYECSALHEYGSSTEAKPSTPTTSTSAIFPWPQTPFGKFHNINHNVSRRVACRLEVSRGKWKVEWKALDTRVEGVPDLATCLCAFSVREGGLSGPASKRPNERARLRVSEEKRNFGERDVAARHALTREPLPHLVDHIVEREIALAKSPLQRTLAHPEASRDVCKSGRTSAQGPLNSLFDAGMDLVVARGLLQKELRVLL